MLTDPKLRAQVDALWDKFWTGEPRLWSSSRAPKCEPREPPLVMFGADAVERWFTEKEVEEVVEFANRMALQ
jgi:hypothetical protein